MEPDVFTIAFKSARHPLLLSWAISIHSIPPHPSSWRSILILSTHLRLGVPSGLFSSGFPIKTLYTPFLSPICATCPTPSHSSRFYHPNNIGWGVQIFQLLIMQPFDPISAFFLMSKIPSVHIDLQCQTLSTQSTPTADVNCQVRCTDCHRWGRR